MKRDTRYSIISNDQFIKLRATARSIRFLSEFHARISKIRGSKIGLDGTSWCPTRHRCARSVTYWQTWTNDSAQLEGSVGPANKAGMGHAIPSLEAGERGEHYHIMLVCNYKLSYPRVNPARYISLESTVSPRIDSSRSIPFGFHPLRWINLRQSWRNRPRVGLDLGSFSPRSNVKNGTT